MSTVNLNNMYAWGDYTCSCLTNLGKILYPQTFVIKLDNDPINMTSKGQA